MKRIAIEEAFWLEGIATGQADVDAPSPYKPEYRSRWAARLLDFTEFRLPEMDLNGIDVHVLSLAAPGLRDSARYGRSPSGTRACGERSDGLKPSGSIPPLAGPRRRGRYRTPTSPPAELRRAVPASSGCAECWSTTTRWGTTWTGISTGDSGPSWRQPSMCRSTFIPPGAEPEWSMFDGSTRS